MFNTLTFRVVIKGIYLMTSLKEDTEKGDCGLSHQGWDAGEQGREALAEQQPGQLGVGRGLRVACVPQGVPHCPGAGHLSGTMQGQRK